MNLLENLHYNLRERILLSNSYMVFGQLFNNNIRVLLVELYYSFYLCFQLADAWSKGNGDKSQRYTLLCARIRKRKGWESNHRLCFEVPWGGICTKTDQNWPEILSRNVDPDVILLRMWSKTTAILSWLFGFTRWWMANLPLGMRPFVREILTSLWKTELCKLARPPRVKTASDLLIGNLDPESIIGKCCDT